MTCKMVFLRDDLGLVCVRGGFGRLYGTRGCGVCNDVCRMHAKIKLQV